MQARLYLLCVFLSGWFLVAGQDKPKKAFQLYEEAEAAYNDDKYAQALGILDECLRHYPGYFEAYALRGSVKEILKDNDGACDTVRPPRNIGTSIASGSKSKS